MVGGRGLAFELIHRPDKPAGVRERVRGGLAFELIHRPDKPAGVCCWVTRGGS
ncbi:MAG: hypothetical protein U9N73_05450 [Candidatus Auribacterota bacterium]|nr:hypothetical protein [Candidatus Auribacterota bacterium]